jgi:hypothetical protein
MADIDMKSHGAKFRHYIILSDCLSNFQGCGLGITDERDLSCSH